MAADSMYKRERNDDYSSLDEFLPMVCSKDTNQRLEVFVKLEDYLKNENIHVKYTDLNKFCESILSWIDSSNFKVSINGLAIIQLLIQRLTDELRNYSAEILTHIIDRFADGKEQVRVISKTILLFMMSCYTPTYIWDKLAIGFNHKLPKVKEETLSLLDETLNKFGPSNIQFVKMVTYLVKLLSDANASVRDKALDSLIEMYRHVGDKLRIELRKKQIPEAKLKLILYKFDEILRNGDFKEEGK